MSRKETVTARERILQVADELFYREGIRAVGVDTIIAKSGVAKTTLYRYFPSKDDLVVAYLEERNQRFWQLFSAAVNKYPNDPKAQLLAVFEWLDELLVLTENCGCPFLIASSEFPELDHPGHKVAIAHKSRVRSRLCELASAAGVRSPKEFAAYMLLMIDGAFAQRRLFGIESVEVKLKIAAATLIEGMGGFVN